MKSRDVPDYADLMTVDEFVEAVRNGSFIDYDGHGNYVLDGQMHERVMPSDLDTAGPKPGFTHVAWFNK